MTKTSNVILLGAAVLLSPFFIDFARGAVAASGGMKVAVIDLDRTLQETPAGKRASTAFEKGRLAKQTELDKKQKELQRMGADLDKQKAVLKPDVEAAKRGELEKFVELQELYVKLERELAGDRQKLITDILKKASPIIEEVAQAEGVTLVVDRSAVIFADKSVDLTDKVNARMK